MNSRRRYMLILAADNKLKINLDGMVDYCNPMNA